MQNDIVGFPRLVKLEVNNLKSVIEELKEEVTRLAEGLGLDERQTKILIWFAEESIGKDGRIAKSTLKQQIMRLGKIQLGEGE